MRETPRKGVVLLLLAWVLAAHLSLAGEAKTELEAGEAKAPLLRQDCLAGEASACRQLAQMYSEGRELPLHPESAAYLYGKSCDLGDPDACYEVAVILRYGQGVASNRREAARRFRQACEGDVARACTELGTMYDGETLPRDWVKSFALFQQACEAGEPHGCHHLAKSIAKGHGAPKDLDRAKDLHRQACDEHVLDSCQELAELYLKGSEKKTRDQTKEETDEQTDGELEPKSDEAKAAELLDRACERGHSRSCMRLGDLYREGRGVSEDRAKATKLYRRACSQGEKESCLRLVMGFWEELQDFRE